MKKVSKPSNETPRREFNWPPTEEELAEFDPTQSARERLRAYFNWPNDEQPPAVEDPPASDEPPSEVDWPSEEPAPSPVIVTTYDGTGRAEGLTSPPPEESALLPTLEATFDAEPAEDEGPLVDPEPAPAEAVAMEYVGIGNETDGIELIDPTNDTELDEPISDQWEVEIARLQTLLDGLTKELEWRATGVALNEPRLKH